MNDGRFDIFDGYGRYEDMSFPHPVLDRPQTEEDDFWMDDPHFEEICSELEAEEAGRVLQEGEAIMEEHEREFERIHDAPLRHLKKR